MGMENTLKLIKDNQKLCNVINSIYNLPYELPFLMKETIGVLDDSIPNIATDSEKMAMCYMLEMYYSSCFFEYGEDLKLDKIIPFGKLEVYKIEARNGLRYATEKEVLHGVKGLIREYVYPAGQESFEMLCLLQWTFCGRSYYLRNAGFKLNYDSSGRVLNTTLQLFNMSAEKLMQMIRWVDDRKNLDKTIKIISKVKKAGGYKYATYANDEIEETITVKQLVYNVLNTFPKGSTNRDYRLGLALASKRHKDNKSLTPYEISMLREVYEKYAMDKDRSILIEQSYSGQKNKLKEECTKILDNKQMLDPGHFVFKIIDTLSKSGYTRCSQKQHKYIIDALMTIDGMSQDEAPVSVLSDDEIDKTLDEMYEALNSSDDTH